MSDAREIFVKYQEIVDAVGSLDPIATATYIQERVEQAGFDPHFPIRVEKVPGRGGYRVWQNRYSGKETYPGYNISKP